MGLLSFLKKPSGMAAAGFGLPLLARGAKSMFGGQKGGAPGDAGTQYLNQIPGVGHEAYDPYIQQGREAANLSQGSYGQMAQNPGDYLNQIMQGYKPSQGYQFRENRLRQGLQNTAAAGGFAGTNQDQYDQSELINALMGQDMQQYLQNITGAQQFGLQGQEQAAQRGYGASSSLADLLGSGLNAQAGLSLQSQNARNEQKMANKKGLLGMLGPLLGAAGGFALGGPGGMMTGAQLGGSIGGGFGGTGSNWFKN